MATAFFYCCCVIVGVAGAIIIAPLLLLLLVIVSFGHFAMLMNAKLRFFLLIAIVYAIVMISFAETTVIYT